GVLLEADDVEDRAVLDRLEGGRVELARGERAARFQTLGRAQEAADVVGVSGDHHRSVSRSSMTASTPRAVRSHVKAAARRRPAARRRAGVSRATDRATE